MRPVRPVRTTRRETLVTFDQESLREFYLDDVLLHEVGHHADRVHHDHKGKGSDSPTGSPSTRRSTRRSKPRTHCRIATTPIGSSALSGSRSGRLIA